MTLVLVPFISRTEDDAMQDKSNTSNPNILLSSEIEELGLEEADQTLGPSWDEVEVAVARRERKNGSQEQ